MTTHIEVNNVSKIIDGNPILSNVDFKVNHGDTVFLYGKNGSGKTTLINIISGIIKPTKGTILIDNLNPFYSIVARQSLGLSRQAIDFPAELKVIEILEFVRVHFAFHFSLEELIENFLLSDFTNSYAQRLSGGQKQRLGLALAFIGKPKLVILDEPSTGLDENAKKTIFTFIYNYITVNQATLLITSHLIEDGNLCNKVIQLSEGQLKYYGNRENIKL